jgi:ParB family chromosome partitioning protein
MASLAASIKAVGLLQPVLVRELHDEVETYELIAGERRWRAARRAGLQTIPVLVQVADDVASLEQALVENLHRVDLNALEEAAAYQQLIDEFGLTHEQVASRVGRGRATITNTLRLLQLPAGAQQALAERTISAGHARALLGTPDRALQERLVIRIVEEGLTVRALEDLVRTGGAELRVVPEPESETEVDAQTEAETSEAGVTTGRSEAAARRTAQRKLPEPGVLELEELLSTFLNTRVKVDIQNRRGRLVVEFATLEDLERIYRAMVGDGGVA